MAKPETSTTTSRRALLGAVVAAPMVTTTTAQARTGPQAEDPHPAWWAEYQQLDAEGLGFADGDAFNELIDEQNDLLAEIATTPAATIAGALAQVRVVKLGIEMGEAAWDEDALDNAIATLERLERMARLRQAVGDIGPNAGGTS